MKYKTEVIEYSPKADDMAEKIELKANEMDNLGYSFVSATVTNSAKAILIFRQDNTKEQV